VFFVVVVMISIENDAFRQSDNLLKVIFAHAKLRNKQSTSCFSNVLKPALFDKNSLAGGS